MASSDHHYVGLDVGGTFLKGGLIDSSGAVVGRLHEPIRKDSADELVDQICAAVRVLAAAQPVRGVGVGLPGIVERQSRVRVAPNVPILDGVPVGEEVGRRSGLPAVVENDANVAALGEAYHGAGQGARNLLFLSLGTGVGGGIILDGQIWTGRSGYAGEIGHLHVDPNGVACGCGSWGCLETIAGNGGWVRRAREGMSGRTSTLADVPKLDPAAIVAAAEAGDALALEVVDGAARAVGIGVAAALLLLNLEHVVIGGGIALAGPFLLDRIREEARVRLFPQIFADATFVGAALGNDAGIVGAATLVQSVVED